MSAVWSKPKRKPLQVSSGRKKGEQAEQGASVHSGRQGHAKRLQVRVPLQTLNACFSLSIDSGRSAFVARFCPRPILIHLQVRLDRRARQGRHTSITFHPHNNACILNFTSQDMKTQVATKQPLPFLVQQCQFAKGACGLGF